MTDLVRQCLTEWLTNWPTKWQGLTDWLTSWKTDWLTEWLTEWLTYWLADRLTERQTDRTKSMRQTDIQITCDHTLPPLYIQTWGRRAWYIYLSDHMLKNQILFFFSDWSRHNTYNTLRSYWLSNFNDTSGQKVDPAKRKQNGGDQRRLDTRRTALW